VREQQVEFFSDGARLAGILRSPDDDQSRRCPAIVQGPGWLGLKDAKLYLPYHEALTAAGLHVLIFDYRGFGDSDGDRGRISPALQLEDLVNAVTYLTTRDDVDVDNLGVFGSGGTGGGNAVMLAATDRRLRAAVAQVPVADGEDWLRRMRPEHEWQAYLARLEEDRRRRVVTGKGEMVHPREEIMVATPERKAANVKADVDARIPTSVPLASAEAIIAYRPVDVAHQVAPAGLLVIGVEKDAVTPTDHAVALYEHARPPKRLIMQRHTTHYQAYARYGTQVTPEIVAWFTRNFDGGAIETRAQSRVEERQSIAVKEEVA
jgi:alpha-beta hydrolase superfamily lysophospholipase